MEILLKRFALKKDYTIGHIYIDGKYECDTIEDKVRDLSIEKKIYSETAIPYGRYRITLKVQSPKYRERISYYWCRGYLPRLLNVPQFEGILIHAGNTAKDSAGCIILGENKVKGGVINSMHALKCFYDKLKKADARGEEIWIEIE